MNRKRNIPLFLMLNDSEEKDLEDKMKRVHMTNKGEFVRKVLATGIVVEIDTDGLNAFTCAVNKLGANINQIAKQANLTKNINQNDIDYIKDQFRALKNLALGLRKKISKINI